MCYNTLTDVINQYFVIYYINLLNALLMFYIIKSIKEIVSNYAHDY